MEDQKFTTVKSHVLCYKIGHPSGMYWADITVDVTGDHSGRINISSDFGYYSNYWGACGGGFMQFLIDLNLEYAADKFGADRWFDLHRTLKGYKHRVLEYRRAETLTTDAAKDIWNEIKELEDCSNKSEFEARMWNQSRLMKMFDNCPDIDYDITPQFRKFWNTVWPVFIEQIKKDIEN